MSNANKHSIDCDFHVDQYDHECTCGAVKPAITEQIHDSRDILQKLDAVENALETFLANDISTEIGYKALSYIPEIRAALEGMQWRPIETCPSDTVVLLYCPDRGLTNEERIECGIYHSTRGGWRHSWATYWQPLPTPPKGGSDGHN